MVKKILTQDFEGWKQPSFCMKKGFEKKMKISKKKLKKVVDFEFLK